MSSIARVKDIFYVILSRVKNVSSITRVKTKFKNVSFITRDKHIIISTSTEK